MTRDRQHIVVGAIAIAVMVLGLAAWVTWLFGDRRPPVWREDYATGQSTDRSGPQAERTRPLIIDESLPGLIPATQPWSGLPMRQLFIPEPPLGPGEILCPAVESTTILRHKPETSYRHEISTRGEESSGLMKFDLSALPQMPVKAVLKACVYGMENTGGYQTPVCMVFYRLTTDWDDSATWQYAKARDRVTWKNGDFSLQAKADYDPAPVATALVPNPTPPGFNVQVDITPIVVGWFTKQYPNYGLLVSNQPGRGYSRQGNLASRRYTRTHFPRIVCTVAGNDAASVFPAPVVPLAAGPMKPERESGGPP